MLGEVLLRVCENSVRGGAAVSLSFSPHYLLGDRVCLCKAIFTPEEAFFCYFVVKNKRNVGKNDEDDKDGLRSIDQRHRLVHKEKQLGWETPFCLSAHLGTNNTHTHRHTAYFFMPVCECVFFSPFSPLLVYICVYVCALAKTT